MDKVIDYCGKYIEVLCILRLYRQFIHLIFVIIDQMQDEESEVDYFSQSYRYDSRPS